MNTGFWQASAATPSPSATCSATYTDVSTPGSNTLTVPAGCTYGLTEAWGACGGSSSAGTGTAGTSGAAPASNTGGAASAVTVAEAVVRLRVPLELVLPVADDLLLSEVQPNF